MIIAVACFVAILSVPLTGRSLRPLARLSLKAVWLVWLSIGLQLIITLVRGFPDWLGRPVHLATFALSGMFLWVNRKIPGALLVALGAGLNLAAIAANNGTMPASESAWHTAGFPTITGEFENSNVTHNARLPWLGDVFAVPKGWPFANVFSVGDVVVVIAVAYFAHTWCRRSFSSEDQSAEAPPAMAAAG